MEHALFRTGGAELSTVKTNPDKEYAREVKKKIKANNGYCPCQLVKNEDTKCPCKDFREMEAGMCGCGLYIKEV